MVWIVSTIIGLITKLFSVALKYPVPTSIFFFLLIVFMAIGEKFGEDVLGVIGGIMPFLSFAVVLGYKYLEKWWKESPQRKATDPKIVDELKNSSGVMFGKKRGATIAKPEYSRDTEGHVLVVGGVGSGKSSCIAIPTLRAWKGRVFSIDVKGELYKHTCNFRENIKVFNPMDDNAVGYNPFHLLEWSDDKVQEAQAIAHALIPIPANISEPFWLESSQHLLTGAILYFYENGCTFIETMEKIQSTGVTVLVNDIKNGTCENAKFFIKDFVGAAEKTITGISLELSRHIMVFATDKRIKNALSKADCISPEDLRSSDIYIQIPENLLKQWKSLLSLITSQFLSYCEKRDENEELTPILCLLDEFPRIGKIEGIVEGLATLRSKKVTITIIIQSLAQLDLVYGSEAREVMCDTADYKLILSASSRVTQENFSKLVGSYDKYKESTTYNFNNLGFQTNISRTETTEDKPIIKPEDFARLRDKPFVLLTPFGFFRVERRAWWD